MFEPIFLIMAGVIGGVINSIAGGGSFVTFPALLAVGVPPVSANATNTFSACAGYLSGAYALKKDLLKYKKELPKLILISVLGGIIGALLLINTPDTVFEKAIPWLMFIATLLFIFGNKINHYLKHIGKRNRRMSWIVSAILSLFLLAVSVYGGFFNAGLGIITLSYLALAGHTNINIMNGLKLLISSAVSLVAIALFIKNGAIAWHQGLMVLTGTLLGGFLAAHLSKQWPQKYIRIIIIITSCLITVYFFIKTY